jgi:hypothetical protein
MSRRAHLLTHRSAEKFTLLRPSNPLCYLLSYKTTRLIIIMSTVKKITTILKPKPTRRRSGSAGSRPSSISGGRRVHPRTRSSSFSRTGKRGMPTRTVRAKQTARVLSTTKPMRRIVASRGTGVTSFVANSAVPAIAHGFRFRDEASCMPSAAVTLHESLFVNQSPGSAGVLIPKTDYFACLFRDLLRSAIMFQANPSAKTYQYDAKFYASGALGASQTVTSEAAEATQVDFVYFTADVGATTLIPYPHGNVLYPGLADGRKGVWLDGTVGGTANISFSQGVAKATANLIVYKWDGRDWGAGTSTAAFAGGVLTVVPTAPGYYAFDYVDSAANANSLGAIISGTGDVCGHFAAPQVNSQLVNLQQVRVLANSLLLSDVASALNAEGSIVGTQFPKGTAWETKLSAQTITSTVNSFTGRLEKGCYHFLKPASNDDYKYGDLISSINGVVNNASFDLSAMSAFTIVYATSNVSGTTYPGLDFLLTHTVAVEFVTENQWFEVEESMYNIIDRLNAVSKLGSMPNFYDNPDHLKQISSMLKRGLSWLGSNGHVLGSALGTLFPQYSAGFNLAGKAIRSFAH